MRKVIVLIAALSGSETALAAEFDVQVDNFTARRGISEAVLKVTNNTGRDVQRVFVDCVFMTKDQRAIDIGKAVIDAIPSGGHAYTKAAVATTDGVELVQCGVVRSR